jgi:hypothetical protein
MDDTTLIVSAITCALELMSPEAVIFVNCAVAAVDVKSPDNIKLLAIISPLALIFPDAVICPVNLLSP